MMQADSSAAGSGTPRVSIAVDDPQGARAESGQGAAPRSSNFWYGTNQALKNINLTIPSRQQVTALIGPSGCGKSTFLRCFNRMHDLQPDTRYEGSITLHPDNINLVGAERRSDRGAHAHRHGVPEAEPVPEDDVRKRGLRPAPARRRAIAPTLAERGREGVAGRGDLGRGEGSAATTPRWRCRAARCSVCASRARWRRSRKSCCSTSRPRRSIRSRRPRSRS